MPNANTFHTPLQQSPAQPQPGQRGDAARKRSGNAHAERFALEPAWPPMFFSRTSDPYDPCYVGRLSDKPRTRAPKPQQRPAGTENLPAGLRLKRGSTAWRIWRLLMDQGAMRTKDIASELDILSPHVWQACRRYVEGEAMRITKVIGFRHELVYSIGPTPLVEV